MQRDNDSEPTEPSSDDQKPASLARMLTPAEMQELRQAQIDADILLQKEFPNLKIMKPGNDYPVSVEKIVTKTGPQQPGTYTPSEEYRDTKND